MSRATEVARQLKGLPQVNWLVVGVDRRVWEQVEARILNLCEPIMAWAPGAQLVLPSPMHAGTMILHDVEALSQEEQRQLLDWLEAGPRAQVISTTRIHVHPRVQAGQFNETLYYRLNIIYVDASQDAERIRQD